MPLNKKRKKILILWSGALKIGEAGEFDYSGSQAIKAVQEEGIETVLINPNIATVQTDVDFANKIYFLPVTPFFVEQVIRKERPDGLMVSFGGQTALNCGIALFTAGILDAYQVSVLGTPLSVVQTTEDRNLFKQALDEIWVVYASSGHATTVQEAIDVAEHIWYPVLVRSAYALWWLGSWFAHNQKELQDLLEKSFSYASQVIIDENLSWWKELEYEVVRDEADNCLTVCNMENVDPMGIHTGESIVVAPSQTLTNHEYHMLRDVAIRTIRHLGIVGECNIQYAFSPKSNEYRVIEVNARLSRSSALASKATGYPLAYVAAKIALWYHLDEITNNVTGVTTAFFEPALDYIVMKFPKRDLQKFVHVTSKIWSEMKSVWEVMAIWHSFEEVLQKSIRNLHVGDEGILGRPFKRETILHELTHPTPNRIFALAAGLASGMSKEEIHTSTGIDLFFLGKIEALVRTYQELQQGEWLDIQHKDLLSRAKKQWFSDKQIASLTKSDELHVRELRKKLGIVPVVKQIDTLAGEFPAQTNYLYTTYHGTHHDIVPSTHEQPKKILVLWSGAYRIGSSVEFDWCSVNTLKTLKNLWYQTIMLNFNPETVSTDYTSSDALYFDEISLEKILDIVDLEKPSWVIVSMGGQIANNLAIPLQKAGVTILWTDPKWIDHAEDRNKFSALLDSIGVDQPVWSKIVSLEDSLQFAHTVWYPVLIRPSYVLSGANMKVCSTDEQLTNFLTQATDLSKDHPAVVSKFIVGAKEIEIDGVADQGELIIYAISEHIENAWIHSWDATIVVPAQKLYIETVRKAKHIAKKIIKQLHITWPFNIQFLATDNHLSVIECNLRASRSFPFVSKITKYNFITLAVEAMVGKDVRGRYATLDLDYVGVKSAQFSFHRLQWADPKLGVEMASTGEVGCLWTTIQQAFLKALLSVGITLPKKNILISLGQLEDKIEFLGSAKQLLALGYTLFATPGTHAFFQEHHLVSTCVKKVWAGEDDIITLMQQGHIDFVINEPNMTSNEEFTTGYMMRRKAVDLGIPLLANIKLAKLFVQSLVQVWGLEGIEILSYDMF